MSPALTNPKAIAKLGEDIYKQKYQAQFEASHVGRFVAINVRTQDAIVGDTPDEALEEASKADPHGMFHLIRVGFSSAFQLSHAATHAGSDWIFG